MSDTDNKQTQEPKRRKFPTASFLFAVSGILFLTLIPFLMSGLRKLSPRTVCGTNLSGLAKAMVVYANDDALTRFPEPDQWCDLLLDDYVEKERFVCPEARKGRCHYAINPNAKPNSLSDMVLLFETKAGWNQSGGPEILTTENHRGEGCIVAFVDTRVEFVRTEELGKLKWKAEESNSGGKDIPE